MSRIYFLGEKDWPKNSGGKKAENLHQLLASHLPIPPGFTIPSDIEIPSLEQLQAALEQIGGFPVAVRSSGQAEDLGQASFAGQYSSYLNVNSLEELAARISDCRKEALSERSRAYAKHVGVTDQAKGFAVFIQRMVPAKVSGVAFGIHPLTGREEHALVELCQGLGEQLVSGAVTPTRIVAEIRDGAIVSQELGSQGATLSPLQCKSLCEVLLDCAAYFGSPQDIEWAIDRDGNFFLLQSRPITKIFWRTDVDEFTNADLKDGGISARVSTRLMLSLYHDAMQVSLPKYLKDIWLLPKGTEGEEVFRAFYGRGYWNASLTKKSLSLLPGYDEEKFDRDLGIQKQYGDAGPKRVGFTPKTLLRAIPVLFCIAKCLKKDQEKVEGFRTDFPKEQSAWRQLAEGADYLSDEKFLERSLFLLKIHFLKVESSYFDTIYNNSNVQTLFKDSLKAINKNLKVPADLLALMGGLDQVSHLEMQVGMVALVKVAKEKGLSSAEYMKERAIYLNQNYFHSAAELELMTPRWGEKPSLVDAMVEGILQSGVMPKDPKESQKLQEAIYEREVARIMAELSWYSRGSFKKKLLELRLFLRLREEMREYSTQTYYVVRLFILELGRRWQQTGRLKDPEDIFCYEREEIVKVLEGKPALSLEEIYFRKRQWQSYRNFVPPNELGRGLTARVSTKILPGTKLLQGLACSPGILEAKLRVIASMDQMGEIRQGEILVTKFTDPGWTPVLGLISGIVTEVGGLLSHAAVISRELGIPAVLNLTGATERLRTGMQVRINGAAGTLEILDETQDA